MRKILVVGLAITILLFAGSRVEADTFGTIQIKYVTWDGTQWSATIQNVVRQINYNFLGIEIGHSIIDPDFTHVENGTQDTDPVRRSDHMDYIADNGTDWTAKIHTHNGGAKFEHCPHNGGSCHDDVIIRFRTWDGTCLQGTLQPFPVPSDGKDPGIPIPITFQSIPCS